MKYILLEDWSRKHGMKNETAKNYARRGKFGKHAKKILWKIQRWVIESNYKP